MRPQELFVQYQEFQRCFGWSDQDARRLRAVFPAVEPHLPALINEFYQEITRHPSARNGCAGGEMQVARLPGTLLAWLDDLFSGVYDIRYVSRRWRLGSRHVEFGLGRVLTRAALSRLRDGLSRLIAEHAAADPREPIATIRSLNKLLDLELAMIEEVYRAELVKCQEQTERLAAIGQFSAGVAHELRNPLNVVKTSVYYLLHTENPTPEKVTEHLQRIARQVEVADAATTALTDFARLQQPCLRPFALEPSLREILETTMLPADIRVGIDCPEDLPCVLGDQQQLMIVFSNLIRNARDAMNGGGTLRVTAGCIDSRVHVAVTDTGVGIKRKDLKKIHEPLYSTKARGMGLGLAISRAILEMHAAELEVTSQPGVGSTFTVRIAAVHAVGTP